MQYAIIGFGAVGKALAQMFARKSIEVAVASTHAPEEIAPQAKAIGPTVVAKSLDDAIKADVILLAVPFPSHREIAKAGGNWEGKIVVDVTNAYGIPPEELDNNPSSTVVAQSFTGAKVVKAFNHLPAKVLAEDPAVNGGRRVIFVSSDDEGAAGAADELAARLGFAPVKLGKLAKGGLLVQARGKAWAPLIFQDLVKFDAKQT